MNFKADDIEELVCKSVFRRYDSLFNETKQELMCYYKIRKKFRYLFYVNTSSYLLHSEYEYICYTRLGAPKFFLA